MKTQQRLNVVKLYFNQNQNKLKTNQEKTLHSLAHFLSHIFYFLFCKCLFLLPFYKLAEKEGFEPSVELPPHTLSRRAPSASRSPLRSHEGEHITNNEHFFKG